MTALEREGEKKSHPIFFSVSTFFGGEEKVERRRKKI